MPTLRCDRLSDPRFYSGIEIQRFEISHFHLYLLLFIRSERIRIHRAVPRRNHGDTQRRICAFTVGRSANARARARALFRFADLKSPSRRTTTSAQPRNESDGVSGSSHDRLSITPGWLELSKKSSVSLPSFPPAHRPTSSPPPPPLLL